MHQIESKPYGYIIVFEGFFHGQDITRFSDDMKTQVNRRGGNDPFAVVVDLRETRTFPPEAQVGLMDIIAYCAQRGMNRNVIVINSAIAKIQANRLARESGVVDIRFIDAAHVDDWEQVAEDWLLRGKEIEAQVG